MILTGLEIKKQVFKKNIVIEPFNENQVNPNSYNYRISDKIMILPDDFEKNQEEYIKIPEEGYLLQPNNVYLSTTHEVIGSDDYVVSLIGRSSIGRLGLFLQISADLSNLGSIHKWTLEIVCTQPIKIYPNMILGQVSFWKPKGKITLYEGEYQNFNEAKYGLYGGEL